MDEIDDLLRKWDENSPLDAADLIKIVNLLRKELERLSEENEKLKQDICKINAN